jgi:hypothetical protein
VRKIENQLKHRLDCEYLKDSTHVQFDVLARLFGNMDYIKTRFTTIAVTFICQAKDRVSYNLNLVLFSSTFWNTAFCPVVIVLGVIFLPTAHKIVQLYSLPKQNMLRSAVYQAIRYCQILSPDFQF